MVDKFETVNEWVTTEDDEFDLSTILVHNAFYEPILVCEDPSLTY